MSPVQFGLFVPQGWILDLVDIEDPIEQYETMSRVAQTAERLGFDSIWLFDHFHTYPEPVLETTFECWTSTAALARDTSRIRLGQMVTCNGYRNPALLAKMASTVDVLSHGRLDFGIGAGWKQFAPSSRGAWVNQASCASSPTRSGQHWLARSSVKGWLPSRRRKRRVVPLRRDLTSRSTPQCIVCG
jgi:hypothetical protein